MRHAIYYFDVASNLCSRHHANRYVDILSSELVYENEINSEETY